MELCVCLILSPAFFPSVCLIDLSSSPPRCRVVPTVADEDAALTLVATAAVGGGVAIGVAPVAAAVAGDGALPWRGIVR